MKQLKKSILGVTLLEIMLVLAIAAMVIVMSIRYYQTATSAQQANTIIEQLQAITVAADSLAQATGSYTSNVTSALLGPLLPTKPFNTPWGKTIAIGSVTSNTIPLTVGGTPSGVCPLMKARLLSNNHWTVSTACGASSADISILYTANP